MGGLPRKLGAFFEVPRFCKVGEPLDGRTPFRCPPRRRKKDRPGEEPQQCDSRSSPDNPFTGEQVAQATWMRRKTSRCPSRRARQRTRRGRANGRLPDEQSISILLSDGAIRRHRASARRWCPFPRRPARVEPQVGCSTSSLSRRSPHHRFADGTSGRMESHHRKVQDEAPVSADDQEPRSAHDAHGPKPRARRRREVKPRSREYDATNREDDSWTVGRSSQSDARRSSSPPRATRRDEADRTTERRRSP